MPSALWNDHVISTDSDEAGRARALRLLGFAPLRPIQVAGAGAILTGNLGDFPDGVRAGIGTVGCPARSWVEAQTALRFTTPRTPVVSYSDLGALALLAQVPPDVLRANADGAAVAGLSSDDLEALDAAFRLL